MTEKELQDILDELHQVDIEHLNEEALRLFKAIMKIADQRDLYKQKLDEIENADLSIVYMDGFYDGEKKWKDKINEKIEKHQKELGKKDKIIKEIAKALVNCVGTCPADYSGDLEEKCEKCNDTYEKCWIEYFEKKVDKEGR